jgi:hypothetical protein
MIDLGVLEQLVNAMYALGCDEETPVVYGEDDGQGWLEVVEESSEARVVDLLTESEQDAQWIDGDGDRWVWARGHEWRFTTENGSNWWTDEPIADFGPYTEILP